jgi:hypothetical protein
LSWSQWAEHTQRSVVVEGCIEEVVVVVVEWSRQSVEVEAVAGKVVGVCTQLVVVVDRRFGVVVCIGVVVVVELYTRSEAAAVGVVVLCIQLEEKKNRNSNKRGRERKSKKMKKRKEKNIFEWIKRILTGGGE